MCATSRIRRVFGIVVLFFLSVTFPNPYKFEDSEPEKIRIPEIQASSIGTFNFSQIGSYLGSENKGESSCYDVFIDSDIMYVADLTYGLIILNISDPCNPEVLGIEGSRKISTIVIYGNYAYAYYEHGNYLYIYNVKIYPVIPTLGE